jgi:hypothetical protein
MGMNVIVMMMLAMMASGGGNELLDYVPTDSYWKVKGVTVSPEAMLKELEPAKAADVSKPLAELASEFMSTREAAAKQIRAAGPGAAEQLEKAAKAAEGEMKGRIEKLLGELKAGSKAQDVRRLMAIRTLGEIKAASARDALKKLTESKEPFVAEYAREADAAIDGKAYTRAAVSDDAWKKDLALMPANSALMVQLRLKPGGTIDFAKVKAALPAMAGRKKIKPDDAMKEWTEMALKVAERTGNIRVDAVTFGLSENVGDREPGTRVDKGCMVAVVRGCYDPKALGTALAGMGVQTAVKPVDGVEMRTMGENAVMIAPSTDRFILTAGDNEAQMPLKALAAALKAGDAAKAGDKVAALVKDVDASKGLWGAVRISDSWKKKDPKVIAAFESATLVGEEEKDGMSFTLKGEGKTAEAVKTAVAAMEEGLKESREEMKREAARQPMMKPIADFIESIQIKAEGAKVTITAGIKGNAAGTFMTMPLFIMMGKSSADYVDFDEYSVE